MLLCRQQIFEQLNKNSVQPTQASTGSQKQGGAELRLLQPATFEVMIEKKTLSVTISLKIGYKVKIYC